MHLHVCVSPCAGTFYCVYQLSLIFTHFRVTHIIICGVYLSKRKPAAAAHPHARSPRPPLPARPVRAFAQIDYHHPSITLCG